MRAKVDGGCRDPEIDEARLVALETARCADSFDRPCGYDRHERETVRLLSYRPLQVVRELTRLELHDEFMAREPQRHPDVVDHVAPPCLEPIVLKQRLDRRSRRSRDKASPWLAGLVTRSHLGTMPWRLLPPAGAGAFHQSIYVEPEIRRECTQTPSDPLSRSARATFLVKGSVSAV
jgi:hypothetical protein